jgi:L-amino acid N-acyltransferase YncA
MTHCGLSEALKKNVEEESIDRTITKSGIALGEREGSIDHKGRKEVICMLDLNMYPKIDLNTYQTKAVLKDGTKIIIKPMVAEDQDALYEFFKSVPTEEARYLRDDVKSKIIVENWVINLNYNKTLPILAMKDDIIIADATINRRRSGWKWHLGTVRIFVHNDYRNIGLGQLLLEEISRIAYGLGIEKLIAEVPDTSIAAINMFTKTGYHKAALIPNMVKDRQNMPVDLAVLIKDIKPPMDESYEYDL